MEHAHFLLQVSTNTSKVRGTKSAMQHTRSEEGSAHDSNRNMLNHDRSSLDQKTLCRHETGAVSLVEKKRRGEQLSQRSAFYAIILKGREWTGEAKMQTRRQVHGHCRWKMETRTGVQQWRSRGVVRPKMYLESLHSNRNHCPSQHLYPAISTALGSANMCESSAVLSFNSMLP
ncbi:uncharacterized protein ACBT57_023253 isoform 3-T6 [Dama dama]